MMASEVVVGRMVSAVGRWPSAVEAGMRVSVEYRLSVVEAGMMVSAEPMRIAATVRLVMRG